MFNMIIPIVNCTYTNIFINKYNGKSNHNAHIKHNFVKYYRTTYVSQPKTLISIIDTRPSICTLRYLDSSVLTGKDIGLGIASESDFSY